MSTEYSDVAVLKCELDELRREVGQLRSLRDGLVSRGYRRSSDPEGGPKLRLDEIIETDDCVFDDDDDAARAFDEFYGAYDEVHVKTRKFLLG